VTADAIYARLVAQNNLYCTARNLPRRDRQGMLGEEELDPSVQRFRRLQID
jgi:hypothetical protein